MCVCLCYSTLLSFSVIATKALFCLSQIAGMCCGCQPLVIQTWALTYSGWDGWFANSICCYFSLAVFPWNIQRHTGSCYLPGRQTRASGSTFRPQHLQGQQVRSVCPHVRESLRLFAMVYAYAEGVVSSPSLTMCVITAGHSRSPLHYLLCCSRSVYSNGARYVQLTR